MKSGVSTPGPGGTIKEQDRVHKSRSAWPADLSHTSYIHAGNICSSPGLELGNYTALGFLLTEKVRPLALYDLAVGWALNTGPPIGEWEGGAGETKAGTGETRVFLPAFLCLGQPLTWSVCPLQLQLPQIRHPWFHLAPGGPCKSHLSPL